MSVCNFVKRRSPSQMFSYQFCNFFQASYSTTHLQTTTSGGFFSLISNSRTQLILLSGMLKARFWFHWSITEPTSCLLSLSIPSENIRKARGTRQTNGIISIKILIRIHIHWNSTLDVHVILFELQTLFSLKSLFLGLTPT